MITEFGVENISIKIPCVVCRKLLDKIDMKKIFARGEGICKKCWDFDDDDSE